MVGGPSIDTELVAVVYFRICERIVFPDAPINRRTHPIAAEFGPVPDEQPARWDTTFSRTLLPQATCKVQSLNRQEARLWTLDSDS